MTTRVTTPRPVARPSIMVLRDTPARDALELYTSLGDRDLIFRISPRLALRWISVLADLAARHTPPDLPPKPLPYQE